jgi:hypothetical protein
MLQRQTKAAASMPLRREAASPVRLSYKTFNRILVDMRHVGIFVLYESEVLERDFGSWNMGYKQLRKIDIERSGVWAALLETGEQEVARSIRPSDALQVLKSFAPSMA